jgi:hypothetical protein
MKEDADGDGFNGWSRGNFLSGARRNQLPGWCDFARLSNSESSGFFSIGAAGARLPTWSSPGWLLACWLLAGWPSGPTGAISVSVVE